MDHLFLDTDVILDLLTGRMPFSEQAAEIFMLAHRGKINAYTSALTYSNAYYVLRKSASHKKIIEQFIKLESIVKALSMPSGIVSSAIHSGFNDLEDALQNYTAISHPPISIIITRNTRDFKHSDMAVMSPQMYLKGRKNHA
jgi:predicted nucleic acid-binding protein